VTGRTALGATLLAVAVLATGCTGNRDLEEVLVDYKNETKLQLALLEAQSEFLTDKGNSVSDKMEALTEDTETLDAEFSIYANRPAAIKREVYEYVSEESTQVAADQAQFVAHVEDSMRRFGDTRNESLRGQLAAMQANLDYHAEFMEFVFTYQDSVNAVFAARFDSRPWYESLIGKWQTQNTP
jgi:hypothetical protein